MSPCRGVEGRRAPSPASGRCSRCRRTTSRPDCGLARQIRKIGCGLPPLVISSAPPVVVGPWSSPWSRARQHVELFAFEPRKASRRDSWLGGVEQLRRDVERRAQRRHRAVDGGVQLAERGLRVDELPAERGLLGLDGVQRLLAVGDQLAQLGELVAGGELAEHAVEPDEDAVEVGVAVVERGPEHREVGEVGLAGGDRLVEALPRDRRRRRRGRSAGCAPRCGWARRGC